jgi:hypothetical protein
MAKLAGIAYRTGHHPIRTIINATTKSDRRSKSRWTQALRYSWRERGRWPSVTRCLDANGGIAGCASKWADQQSWKRTPPGYVRVGGEDRVPKIPFLVGVDMLDDPKWRSLCSARGRIDPADGVFRAPSAADPRCKRLKNQSGIP